MPATKFLQIIFFFSTSNLIEIKYQSPQPTIELAKLSMRKGLLDQGIGAKLVSNWEQNMLYIKFRKFYVEKGYLC